MSFSSEVKREIARSEAGERDVELPLLSGIVRFGGTLVIRKGEISFFVRSREGAVARRTLALLERLFDIRPQVAVEREAGLNSGNVYVLKVEDCGPPGKSPREILEKLGIILPHAGISPGLPWHLLGKESSRKAYLQGGFLASGYVYNPERGYHLEFVAEGEDLALELCELLDSFDIPSRITRRRGKDLVYVKGADNILRVLGVLGASSAVLQFESLRVTKSLRNQVNRLVNCDTGNVDKAIDASSHQIECIKTIAGTIGISNLPSKLAEACRLRLTNPEASLSELAGLANPPVSKSAMNHRMRRIEEIARHAREGGISYGYRV